MQVDPSLFPAWWLWFSTMLFIVLMSLVLWHAPWRALSQVPARLHLLCGGAFSCLLLWLLAVEVVPGVSLHFLGVTSLTLILGGRFAVLAGAAALLGLYLLKGLPLQGLPTAWLLSVMLPALSSRGIAHALQRTGIRNLFLFMLGAGFGGGMLSVLVVAVAGLPLLALLGQFEWVVNALEQWPLIVLFLFPEGFINGVCVTSMTVFFPHAVKTFDDRHYLG